MIETTSTELQQVKRNQLPLIGAFILGVGAAVVLIYFTPLRLIPLIEPNIRDVAPQEIAERMNVAPEEYIFLDVRPTTVFEQEHASGSKSAPLHTLYDLRHALPKKGKTIVLICSGGRASGVGYSYLEHFGFFNVVRVEGGIEAWKEASLPVTSGEDSYQ